MSLIIVGTVAFDSIETPSGKADRVVGGAASYIALAASHFVREQDLISVIGEDFPNEFLDTLRSRGVNTEGLMTIEGGKSFFWEGSYHEDLMGRDTITTELNVLEGWTPVVPENAKSAKYVMLGNLDPSVQMSVLDQMPINPDLVVLDTMNFWMDIAMENLKKVISRVDVLMINDEEARQLTGQKTLPLAAAEVHKMGPKTVVIKKGEHGAIMFENGNTFFSPAMPLEKVIDPTGAGDTFAGGFIGYLARLGDNSWEAKKQAVVVGSVLASFTCEDFGTERLQTLQESEWHTRMQELRAMVKFRSIRG
ncbi:MAG: PfkB family carbohydrate kinase [Flavobacteriales bacterium]|jgi:sugar/nucleoside kinase (ribokinase family)